MKAKYRSMKVCTKDLLKRMNSMKYPYVNLILPYKPQPELKLLILKNSLFLVGLALDLHCVQS